MSNDILQGLPILPGTEPAINLMDLAKTAIAVQVAKSLSVSSESAYACVDATKKGPYDFSVAVPRLRLAGKPDEHAKKVASEVSGVRCNLNGLSADAPRTHSSLRTTL